MKLLAQFKVIPNYVDFCIPELKALISLYNLDWREVFKHEFSCNDEGEDAISSDSLYYSYPFYKDSLEKKPKLPNNPEDIRHSSFRRFPFLYLEFPSIELAQLVISRSILLDVFIEVISEGRNYDDLILKTDHSILLKYNGVDQRLSIEVDPYNSHITQKEVIERIEILTESLHINGKIDLKNPTTKYWLMERHIDPYTQHTDTSIISTLLDVFFGAEIGRSKSCSRISKENVIHKYDLKNRVYLGPTSTDNQLSFLMSNQGSAQQGSLILDPFVGSGSLLIPASHFGSLCFGGDLDPRVLHGLGVGRLNKQSKFYQQNVEYCEKMMPKIMLNFEQYNLNKPNIIRMDCINTSLRHVEAFDAIICDPPYGFRAMTKTAGKKEKKKKEKKNVPEINKEEEAQIESSEKQEEQIPIISQEAKEKDQSDILNSETQSNSQQPHQVDNIQQQKEEQKTGETAEERPHYPQMVQVTVDSIVSGLVDLANKILVPGGRLVFLYPIDREVYNQQGITKLNYPNFVLLDYSENPLSEKKSRILITLQKLKSIQQFQKEQENSAVTNLENLTLDNPQEQLQKEEPQQSL